MDKQYIMSVLEAILFASGEPVPAERIALVIGASKEEVFDAAETLKEQLIQQERGIRLLRLDDKLQLCSAPEHSQTVTHALEQRKPPKLSPSALEVLAITAYFQPVTRAYIDQVRGVDSSYTVGMLLERGLIESCGKLDVPGHPTLYRTSDVFLRTMNISSLDELPELPDTGKDDGMIALQNKIDMLRSNELEMQMSFDDET